jgi:hypothetical protein
MSWSFNPKTMRTDDEAEAPIRRIHVEEAIARLSNIGIRSRPQLVSIVTALSGLSKKEVTFNVELVVGKEAL